MKPIFAAITSIAFAITYSAVAERPNVLFLAVDDMKDWVNCLGGYEGEVLTPNIDRLANRGVLFTNAHCPSPKCAPSRSAILTGFRPSTTGLYDNGHWWYANYPDMITIPKVRYSRRAMLKTGGAALAATALPAPMVWGQETKDIVLRQFGTGVSNLNDVANKVREDL
ncbi:MAG: sulfatase-like hydrolase/transferase, partial [Verrucomicrobiota bacterium]